MFLRASGRWQQRKWATKGGDNEKGTNNASGVVWASSKFIFLSFMFV